MISVTPIHFEQLNEQHAKQENMSLAELKQVIREIYPNDNNFL
ncbi:ASCH domain [Actinobacillus equuli]|nr:ASCH domain [Actinobacillus equuli]